tara:strand:- start:287 stop:775 length:489 start_codon:yes stop_codon:yes gene_type:complete
MEYIYMSCNSCQNIPITGKCITEKAKRKRIWKQSGMSASHGLFRKKTLLVSKMVGESACPGRLSQAGGPGDLWRSGKGKQKKGVDKKHGSYARYLARRVGGELRKEKGRSKCYKNNVLVKNTDNTCCDNRIPTKAECGTLGAALGIGNPGVAVPTDCGCCSK